MENLEYNSKERKVINDFNNLINEESMNGFNNINELRDMLLKFGDFYRGEFNNGIV